MVIYCLEPGSSTTACGASSLIKYYYERVNCFFTALDRCRNKLQRKLRNSTGGPTHSTGTKHDVLHRGHTSFWAPTRLLRSKNGYNISKQIFQHARSFPKRCATAFFTMYRTAMSDWTSTFDGTWEEAYPLQQKYLLSPGTSLGTVQYYSNCFHPGPVY